MKARVLIGVLLVVGALIWVGAVLLGDDGSGDVTISANEAVNAVYPGRGDEVLQQSRVGVDLDARYQLVSLVVYPSDGQRDGVDVTVALRHSTGLNLWEFIPGEGQPIQALSPDTNCATATYAPIAQPSETETFSWCFEVS